MLKKALFGALVAPVLLCACGQRMDKQQLKVIDQGFSRADAFVREQNSIRLHELDTRLADPQTRRLALLWTPVAKKVQALTDSIDQYMLSLSSLLADGRELSRDRQARLMADLREYKQNLVKVFDSTVLEHGSWVTKEIGEMSRHWPLLHDSSIEASGTAINLEMLNKLRLDNLLTATRLLRYCDVRSAYTGDVYDKIDAIISVSSTHVTQGEPVIVLSGIGAFSSRANQKITVGGKLIKINDEGIAVDTINTRNQSGKHTIRVNIEYTRPDGRKMPITKTITYKVFPAN